MLTNSQKKGGFVLLVLAVIAAVVIASRPMEVLDQRKQNIMGDMLKALQHQWEQEAVSPTQRCMVQEIEALIQNPQVAKRAFRKKAYKKLIQPIIDSCEP